MFAVTAGGVGGRRKNKGGKKLYKAKILIEGLNCGNINPIHYDPEDKDFMTANTSSPTGLGNKKRTSVITSTTTKV